MIRQAAVRMGSMFGVRSGSGEFTKFDMSIVLLLFGGAVEDKVSNLAANRWLRTAVRRERAMLMRMFEVQLVICLFNSFDCYDRLFRALNCDDHRMKQ